MTVASIQGGISLLKTSKVYGDGLKAQISACLLLFLIGAAQVCVLLSPLPQRGMATLVGSSCIPPSAVSYVTKTNILGWKIFYDRSLVKKGNSLISIYPLCRLDFVEGKVF